MNLYQHKRTKEKFVFLANAIDTTSTCVGGSTVVYCPIDNAHLIYTCGTDEFHATFEEIDDV